MKNLVIIAFMALFAVSCTPKTVPVQTPIPTSTPIQIPPPSTPTPTSPTLPTATAAPTKKAPTTFLDTDWNDRTPFLTGLHSNQQSVLNEFLGASVYHLNLTLAADMTHLKGTETVRYTNTENTPLNEIYFRLFPNVLGGESIVSNLRVNDTPVQPNLSVQNSVMRVALPEVLLPNNTLILTMDFAVTVPTEVGRNYASFAFLDGILALPHFYPMIAVFDDEGWNIENAPPYGDVVYADTSFFLAKITAPAKQTMVTSGVTLDSVVADGMQTLSIAAGPMRDFYLVMSDRYELQSTKIGETTINSFAPSSVTDQNKQALGYVASALGVFNELIGEYPFTELDLVATPTTAGGIEYPGAIVLALGLYQNQREFFEVAAVHETAHQWFYSLVGNDQIDDPWLDESLVQYLTWLFYRKNYGDSGDVQMTQMMNGYWSRADKAETPIGLPVQAYDEQNYGAIVYGRGPLFFNALEKKMGEERFNEFLRTYFRQYEWGIATPEGLQSTAENVCECDLSEMFARWVYPQK